MLWQLTHTVPALMRGMRRCTRDRSFDQIDAPSPYWRVVRKRDGVVDVVVRQRDHHRPEDLLLHDPHVLPSADQHRRRHEIALFARAAATRHDGGALLAARFDVAADALHLLLRNERPELARGIETRTELHLRGNGGKVADHAIEQLALHVQARSGGANLALVEEDGLRCARGRRRGIRVVEHDDRRLAAELE